jgi:hypothetical protein
MRQLQLFIGKIYKCSINPITNPNPIFSHQHVTVYIPSHTTNICIQLFTNYIISNVLFLLNYIHFYLYEIIIRPMTASKREVMTMFVGH